MIRSPDDGQDSGGDISDAAREGEENAGVNPVASVLSAWGRMPRVQTPLEYLARKLPIQADLCAFGLHTGGGPGTVVVIGSLAGLFVDTAWRRGPGAAARRPVAERPSATANHTKSGNRVHDFLRGCC